jgi:hypothetical protein
MIAVPFQFAVCADYKQRRRRKSLGERVQQLERVPLSAQ